MQNLNNIPVVDLFAGSGGLSEGFTKVTVEGKPIFKLPLSVEMDKNAIQTLKLRSFYRKFNLDKVPEEYYQILKEQNLKNREKVIQQMYKKFQVEAEKINNEVWKAELGSNKNVEIELDRRIKSITRKNKHWVLLGGPPCQAYSLAGRSRVGGINENDDRVYLYKEYLRIIAKHQPSVFVMENVKGLLSAKVKNEHVFDLMKKDLSNPSIISPRSRKYKIYSLVAKPDDYLNDGFPVYKDNKSFVIKAEMYGIPQKRHRIILLGVREDIDVYPDILQVENEKIKLKEVIGDLPKIRSELNRNYLKITKVKNKKKRVYENVIDSNKQWSKLINKYKKEITSWNGLNHKKYKTKITAPKYGTGSEFVECDIKDRNKRYYDWYFDPKLRGMPNHQSRSHLIQDLKRYLFASLYTDSFKRFPRLYEYFQHSKNLLPDHKSAESDKFIDRFRVQLPDEPATTITSHIARDGHYFIHYDYKQCRSLTVREAARIQTFQDNYLFCGSRTSQFQQVGNAVPPLLAYKIASLVYDLMKKI